MKDDKIEGDFFLYIYLSESINNWMLRSKMEYYLPLQDLQLFAYVFWTCVWVSCAFLFPILLKAAPTGVLSKTFPDQSLKTGRTTRVCLPLRHAAVPDMGLLFMGLNLHPPQYIMYIILWSIWLFRSSTALSGFLIPTTSSLLFPLSARLSICIFLCVWRVFWNSLEKEELLKRWTFLSTEWNLATGICHSEYNLSSKLEG